MSLPTSITWDVLTPVANHLWQSTVVLAVCAALAWLLRHNRAYVRHWIWLTASIKFALPFALLVDVGRRLAVPLQGLTTPGFIAAPAARAIVEPFSDAIVTPGAALVASATPPSGAIDLLPAVAAAVWLLGALAIAGRWWLRARQLRAIAAAARPGDPRVLLLLRAIEARANCCRPLRLVVTDSSLEPGVLGILRPLLLWPGGMSARLDDGQIEAVLAHELSHVRRHDNATAALHMVVEAMFWFHPLVWWLGTRLIDERERACDEAVLLLGSDPETYAESILETCRFQIESPLACVAGVTGADLKRRIAEIMDGRVASLLTFRRKLLLAAAAMTVLVVPIFAGTLQGESRAVPSAVPFAASRGPAVTGRMLHQYSLLDAVGKAVGKIGGARFAAQGADASTAAAAAGATFEVASVKPNQSGEGTMQIGVQLSRFVATNMPLRQLIIFAYGVQPFQIEGGPEGLMTQRFDINARIPDRFVNTPTAPGETGPVNYMMRALLADRFKLVIERSTKDAPIYELQLARADGRLGPKLTVSQTDCAALFAGARAGGPSPAQVQGTIRAGGQPLPEPGAPPPCGQMMGPGNIAGGSSPMTQLARTLSNRVGRTVIDKTGLPGNYDFSLTFAPDFGPGGGRAGQPPTPPPGAPPLPPIDADAPTIFTALQEQLGLKLEAKHGPVDTLVIKRVEMPAAD